MPSSELFSFARITMTLTGIWKLELSYPFKRFTDIYKTYSVLVHLIYISVPLLMTLNIPYLLQNNPSEAPETLSKTLYCILLLVKLFSYQSENSKFLLTEAIVEEAQLYQYADSFTKVIYEKHVLFCNRLNRFILISVALSGALLWEIGIVDSYKFHKLLKNESQALVKPLPLKCWYPFDENKYHVWVLIEQLLTLVWFAISIVSVHTFINSVLIYTRGQLKILQNYFSNFHRNIFDGGSNGSLAALKLLCGKHQYLIAYLNIANQTLKTVVFLEYGISSIMLATALLQVIAGKNVITNVVHVSVIISQLLLLAWSSDEIVTQSLQLAPALYQSKWYECDRESRILIRIMLMRCQKPLSIDIGSFGPMTVRSAMSRLKLAYSYTSVMTN
ncbi:odorant receptor 49b-like isoform X2 [Cylas formicarius]|uniref:odorant receptor 49b-like isoform X2 n=1 Tax=Cylas formicarius TaxID=197179 RepID=UPI002958399F|nr:odorant receptor 49b-like isoform X2 [Cylas formicarius]